MDYLVLMRRIRASAKDPARLRVRLYLHRDEVPSLLRSLEIMHEAARRGYRTPLQVHKDMQDMHETLAAMRREIDRLKQQLHQAKNQAKEHSMPCAAVRHPDEWQRQMLDEANQRRQLGAWQNR